MIGYTVTNSDDIVQYDNIGYETTKIPIQMVGCFITIADNVPKHDDIGQ